MSPRTAPRPAVPVQDARRWWEAWAGPAALVATAVAMALVARAAQDTDFTHMYQPVKAVIEGRWSEIYPAGTPGTSPTGWVALMTVFTYGFSRVLPLSDAFTVAALLVLPGLLVAVRFAVRALWPTYPPAAAWGLAVAAVWLPTTLATYLNAYHPQDLAATALVIAGLGLVAKRQWWGAGAVFGVAVLTRQWALLAFIPAAGFAGKDVWKLGLGAGVVGVVLMAPVLLTGNEGWLTAFSAGSVQPSPDTVLGRLRYHATLPGPGKSGSDVWGSVSRLAPVLGAVVLGAVAWGKRLRHPAVLVAFALSGLGLRMLFETSNYLYYWVPFAALCVLLIPHKKTAWLAVAGLALGPWAIDALWPPVGTIESRSAVMITSADQLLHTGATLALSLGVLVAALLLGSSPEDVSGTEAGSGSADPADDPGGVNEAVAPRARWRWAVGGVAVAAVLVPYVAGWLVPNPPARLRETHAAQVAAWTQLRDQGAPVGAPPVNRLDGD